MNTHPANYKICFREFLINDFYSFPAFQFLLLLLLLLVSCAPTVFSHLPSHVPIYLPTYDGWQSKDKQAERNLFYIDLLIRLLPHQSLSLSISLSFSLFFSLLSQSPFSKHEKGTSKGALRRQSFSLGHSLSLSHPHTHSLFFLPYTCSQLLIYVSPKRSVVLAQLNLSTKS